MLLHLNKCSEDSFEMNAKLLWMPDMVVFRFAYSNPLIATCRGGEVKRELRE